MVTAVVWLWGGYTGACVSVYVYLCVCVCIWVCVCISACAPICGMHDCVRVYACVFGANITISKSGFGC